MSRQLELKKATEDTDKLVRKGAFEENYISEGLQATEVWMSCFCVSEIRDVMHVFAMTLLCG